MPHHRVLLNAKVESQIIFTASEMHTHRVSPMEILHLFETPI